MQNETQLQEPSSTEPNELPDALLEAGAVVIAKLRREWAREMEVVTAQSREVIASLRAEIVEMKHGFHIEISKRLSDLRDGEPGRNGADGQSGDKGDKGEKGDKGDRGEQGERGNDGEQGPEGKQGPAGEQGPSGAQGERGEAGEPGRNGEKGDKGETGQKGAQGEKGEQGESGLVGKQGSDGEPGANGAKGDKGDKGDRGEPGLHGVKGDPGEPGRNGVNGDRGEPGPRGEKGEHGEAGPRGVVERVVPWTDRIFYQGDMVTHLGSCWQAAHDTAKEPGGSDDWRLIAAAGEDGAGFNIRGTYKQDEKYRRLDVVTLDHGWFVAKKDNPGEIPGPDWQSGPVGRKGEKGVPGDRGPKGEPGKAAPHWTGAKIDGYTMNIVLSDGTIGPEISLSSMFDLFEVRMKLRNG